MWDGDRLPGYQSLPRNNTNNEAVNAHSPVPASHNDGHGDRQPGQNRRLTIPSPTGSPFSLDSNNRNAENNDNDDAESRQPLLLHSPSPLREEEEEGLLPVPPPLTWRAKLQALWLQSKGMVFVMLSQFFGASMNVMTQVLEVNGSHGPAMHPFQILFARMSITVIASYLYMWYAKVPNPFGTRPVLGLLIMRAVCGFFGVYGLYYSVQYMALSEATVLTFLAPILSCYASSFLIPGETFTRKQQFAGLVSLLGVVLIARPFSSSGAPGQEPLPPPDQVGDMGEPNSADTYHHFLAIGAALMGVLGASFAYVAIRMIGPRAHPLVSVTYFSAWTMIISTVALVAIPSVPFRFPGNLIEWTLLLGLGVCGFILQFLLTAGLSYVPPPPPGRSPRAAAKSSGHGSRATFMLYTQMLFALFYDKVIWGSILSPLSWAGSGLILGCAIYVAVVRDESTSSQNGQHAEGDKDDVTAEAEERHLEDGSGASTV